MSISAMSRVEIKCLKVKLFFRKYPFKMNCSFHRLTEELSQKEADLEALRRDMFSLQRRQEETERAEAEIKRKASASHCKFLAVH